MSIADGLLRWIEHTYVSGVIRQSRWAVMALEAVHLLGLALLGGTAVIVGLAALRSTGLRGLAVAQLARELRTLALIGLLLMAGSGSLIAISTPFKYYNNAAFQWKMLLLICALGTHSLLLRASTGTDAGDPSRVARQRGLGLLSMLLWIGVGFSGRLIGFL